MTPQKYYLSNKNGFKLNQNNESRRPFTQNNPINKQSNNIFNTNETNKSIHNTFNTNENNKINNTFKTDNINNIIKKIIIDYIYNKIELKEHKFIQINNSSDIFDLNNYKNYISPNYGGVPSLLIFLKYDDEYHCYLIDRRSLSFKGISNSNTNYMLNTIRMTKINLSIDIKFYDGTIFDCCLIDNVYNDQLQIIINDIFYFCNKSLLTVNYKKKIFLIKTFIDSNYENNKNDNACLHISPTYELNKIQELFIDYIGINLTFLNIKGITFYPKNSATKLIYIFDKLDNQYKDDIINNKININKKNNLKNENIIDNFDKNDNFEKNYNDEKNNNDEKILKFELNDITNDKDIILNFEMKKTKKSDVYKLYSIFNINTKYYKKYIGTPYIPSYKHTLKCKNFFEKTESIIIECLFHSYKGLWIPQKISDIQKIDIINKDSRIKIIETIVNNNNNYDEIF